MFNNTELLAPAGNKESFLAALNAGADAIYMGIDKYNARNMAQNFSIQDYIECINMAHARNVKVYLTMNTLLYNIEIKDAMDTLLILYSRGLDAVILQDIGLAKLIKDTIPGLALHASTQMSVYNLEGVKYLENMGFNRVVLARELSIDEIENIVKNTKVEIEVFVHGALCVCLSGGCQMSALIGDRSANRGSCAQPCRQAYSLYKNDKKIVDNKYLLSKKDIYGIDYIDKLAALGVKSFKVEGRNRSPEYVAGVISIYRKKLDENNLSNADKKDLLQLFNRSGKSEGYFGGVLGKDSISLDTPKNTGLKLGEVLEYTKPYVKVKLEEKVSLHDGIEIYSKDGVVSNIITNIKNISKKKDNIISDTGDVVLLGDIKQRVENGSIIYKTSDSKLNVELYKKYVENIYKRKNKLDVSFELTTKHIKLFTDYNGNKFEVISDYIPQRSIKNRVSYDSVITMLSKTENTPYLLNLTDCKIENELFVPTSVLNELRRNFVAKLDEKVQIKINTTEEQKRLDKNLNKIQNIKENKNTSVINSFYTYSYNPIIDYTEHYENKYGKKLNRIYLDIDCIENNNEIIQSYLSKNIETFAVLSSYILGDEIKLKQRVENVCSLGINGLVISNLSQIKIAKEIKQTYNIKLVLNYTMNVVNTFSTIYFKEQGFDEVIVNVDATEDNITEINNVLPVTYIKGVITAMTSRYCMVKSFGINTKECNNECKKNRYSIIDNFGKKYEIIIDSKNHIMRLVRNNSKKYDNKCNVLTTEC